MPGFFTDGELASDPGSIFDYDVTAGEAFGSGFGRQFDTNPLALVARQARYLNDDLQNIAGGGVDWVDQEKAAGEVQSRGLDLKIPKGGIARHELDMLQYLKQREIEQNTTSARTRGVGPTAAGFAGGLAASLTDPINVASGFIPIVNQVRYAQWLARAGEGVFARAAVRAGAGAIEGAVGAALIEPIVYAGATSEQLDYGLMDSFLNVTMGGVLGGGLHSIGGGIYDWGSMPVSDALAREGAANAPEHVKREAMQAAVEALERGEPVDVEDMLRAYHGSPHMFERFDVSRIGDGEGNQAFGHGLYFAQSRGTAEFYRDTVGAVSDAHEIARTILRRAGGDHAIAIADLEAEIEWRHGADTPDDMVDALSILKRGDDLGSDEKYLYEVKIKARTDELLDYNKTIGEQSPQVRAAIKAAGYLPEKVDPSKSGLPVSELVQNTDPKTFAADMRAQGVKGIQYLDASSRSAGEGTRNFVIFDDADVNIVSRNGEPTSRQPGPRGLSDLIPEARADRTDAAFTRQFVDKADEVIAAEKARPKDKIESVKQDEAEFRDMVEEYRGQGRLTTETVKVDGREVLSDVDRLKQADELAAWAERRAKAFEAAAGCIEAA